MKPQDVRVLCPCGCGWMWCGACQDYYSPETGHARALERESVDADSGVS